MASSSRSSDHSHGDNDQSQTLKITLSDLDMKMKAVMALVEEDDGSSGHRFNIYNSKTPELLHRLRELQGSYNSMADKCNTMFSKAEHMLQSVGDYPETVAALSREESVTRYADAHNTHRLPDYMISTKLPDNNSRVEAQVMANQMTDTIKAGDFQSSSIVSSEMKTQVTELMEENLRQQAELVKRNAEKRARIERLQLQMEHLRSENIILRKSIGNFEKDKRGRGVQMQILGKLLKKLTKELISRVTC